MPASYLSAFRVFIGWDSREAAAFDVAKFSMLRRATVPVQVEALDAAELRSRGFYWRDRDPLASTEFTYTRFLTPFLSGFRGWALYCDCDFLWLEDVARLFALADSEKAVMCVKHDYRPPETVKMDGRIQSAYPRKNWSSLMMFNCGHASLRDLTPELVNTASPAHLHRMQWVPDELIGSLPEEWNWLEGWSAKPLNNDPKAIHFTRGGPWFDDWMGVEYADRWLTERDAERDAQSIGAATSR